MYSPLWKIIHRSPLVLCTPPFEKSPIEAYWFCVLPPLKNHPSKPIVFVYSPLWKINHQKPSVLCTPPFEKSPIEAHWFCVLPPLKNHPSKPIGFVYSPLWKITHQNPSVLCTPPFENSLFLVGAYFGKYGMLETRSLKFCTTIVRWDCFLVCMWYKLPCFYCCVKGGTWLSRASVPCGKCVVIQSTVLPLRCSLSVLEIFELYYGISHAFSHSPRLVQLNVAFCSWLVRFSMFILVRILKARPMYITQRTGNVLW